MHPKITKKRRKHNDDEEADAASCSSAFSFDRHVFPVLLACTIRPTHQDNSSSSAAACLLRRVLSRSPPPSPLPNSLAALLPCLLSSSGSSVAALSCELVGAAALQSMVTSETLASDTGVTNGLARALGSRSNRVAEAACNAIMDLSASSVGREHLASSPVLPRLLYLFSQVESISVYINNRSTKHARKASRANKFLYLIIDTVVLMINSCEVNDLHRLQHKLVEKVLPLLYKICDNVQCLASSANGNSWKNYIQSREYEVSEAIFRLSMDLAYPAHVKPDDVRKGIFGQTVSDFESFVLNYWEKSPNLYRRIPNDLVEDTVFTVLLNAFDPGTPDAIIESLMQGLVSCPAIASDDLDIKSFLHEVHGFLGAAVKYRQDIRVVRTQDPSYGTARGCGIEEHFFDDGTIFPDISVFIEKCKDAFKNGFSVALRGMEFRSEKVAAISVALADLFGQPSVGANIYLSPPNSQGLARHYDDHCVLVWQLFGCKKWMIWPHPKSILPRLYDPFDSLDDLVDDYSRSMEVLFQGDMMYIPRGYIHEAQTNVGGGESQVNASAGYSLHLTLAIEVEPPFEWEGFAHISLHCWTEKNKLVGSQFAKSKTREPTLLFALLLHVAIRLLADLDPTFRKACMVAAKLPSSSSCNTTDLKALRSNQRSNFDQIINKIDENCSFAEALRCIEVAVKERNDEPFQWMSWLRHLPQHGDPNNRIDFCNILVSLEELLEVFDSNIDQAWTDFIDFKSKFCRFVMYEDACESFEMLLQMYRTTRNQYMKGMLALHRKN